MKRSYLWLFVVLAFFAAVSVGGCGGSSSSGGDVAQTPDTNGDDYGEGEDYGGGNNSMEAFARLNGTKWKIVGASMYGRDKEEIFVGEGTLVEDSYTDNNGLILGTNGDSLSVFNSSSEPLYGFQATFRDSLGRKVGIDLVIPADGFKAAGSNVYRAELLVSENRRTYVAGYETVSIKGSYPNIWMVTITMDVTDAHTAELVLVPAD
ncbi:MAG: hypothetical protein IJR85_07715 [Synergistaceae bacterium]|nr:hypothetical protein [Synergistaceae bacterium]